MKTKSYYEKLRDEYYELNNDCEWEVDRFIDIYSLLVDICEYWDKAHNKETETLTFGEYGRRLNSAIKELEELLG